MDSLVVCGLGGCVNWEWCVDCVDYVVGCGMWVDCVVGFGLCDGVWTVWWGVDCVMLCGLCGGVWIVCGLCGAVWIV